MRKPFAPRGYQSLAIKHMLHVVRCALWAGMGMGKTVSTLSAFATLKERGELGIALVVAPLRVARGTWPAEALIWEHLSDLDVRSICGGTPKKREKLFTEAICEDADVLCINYESLPWLLEHLAKLKMPWPFSTVVADEASKLRGFRPRQGTKRAKALYDATKADGTRFIQLTGTPSPKGLMDLFGQVYFLDHGERLGKTYSAWTGTYFNEFKLDQYVSLYSPKKGALEQVMGKVKDLALTLKPEDYFDLKAPQISHVWVDLPPKVLAGYKELQTEFITHVAGFGLKAPNSAVLSNRLLQMCSGAVYREVGKADYEVLHDEKLDALESVIEELGGEQLLVVYQLKSDLDRLKKRFPELRELKTQKDEDDWNKGDGTIPLLAVHPASAGHGLNLQHGGRNICFFAHAFDLELFQQVRERVGPVRQLQSGYDRVVREFYILARGTVDELCLQRLEGRAITQDEVMAWAKPKGEAMAS